MFKHRFLILFILSWYAVFPVCAQDDFVRIRNYFTTLSDFDYQYPRERVYLHLDNNSYVEGETLWFKAYVVRASSLLPQPLSRVLYVELVDKNGDLIERKQLRIDSLGQAHGDFSLELPIRGGQFYEIRAYTREMLNWSDEVVFSRIVPIFKKQALSADEGLDIIRPEIEADLSLGHTRPYDFSRQRGTRLSFYPEGGHRVKGITSRIAYELTDGHGMALSDSISVYKNDGTLIATCRPTHEGRGTFTIQGDIDEAYAMVGKKRFDLPIPSLENDYALRCDMGRDLEITVTRREDATPELLGIVVMCRDEGVYFDTLTVADLPVTLEVDHKLLGDGVNRVEIINSRGQSLAQRLVWGPPTARRVTMHVQQNASSYKPFSPIALEFGLSDVFGHPVETTFSLAIRDGESDLTASTESDLCTDLLLCSELKGYVQDPDWYFRGAISEAQREALDVLLMVQGWTANRIETMIGEEAFAPKYPVEDRLVLNGRVLKNNNRGIPLSNVTLRLRMFNKEGYSLQSEAVTDSTGAFTFASNEDYMGDWIAQFSTRVNDRLVWSRVALDRWFGPKPRPIAWAEMNIAPPADVTEDSIPASDLFVWNDSIPETLYNETLGEAVVTYSGYRGLRGNKYTYLGGEQAGMRHATSYYNIEQIVERAKDAGESPGLIWDILHEKDEKFSYTIGIDNSDAQYTKFLTAINDTGSFTGTEVYTFKYGGRPAMVFVDNELFLQLAKGDNPIIFGDEVKSVVIMRESSDWRLFMPGNVFVSSDLLECNPTAIFLYTRPDFSFFRTKKGVEKRGIHGYAVAKDFYHPNYRAIDMPTSTDHRRTLYWNPSMQSDRNGRASVVFFNNAHTNHSLRITARGITHRGGILYFEK